MKQRPRGEKNILEAKKQLNAELREMGLAQQLGEVNLSTVVDTGFAAGFDAATTYRLLLWLGVARMYTMTTDERFILRAISGSEFVRDDDDLPF